MQLEKDLCHAETVLHYVLGNYRPRMLLSTTANSSQKDLPILRVCRSDQVNLFSVLGGLFAATLFLGVNNASNVQPVVAVERTIFYRERAAGMYSAVPYAIGQVKIDLYPVQLLIA